MHVAIAGNIGSGKIFVFYLQRINNPFRNFETLNI